jgi:hypothetical protein
LGCKTAQLIEGTFMTWWEIWKERNQRIFEQKLVSALQVSVFAIDQVRLWDQAFAQETEDWSDCCLQFCCDCDSDFRMDTPHSILSLPSGFPCSAVVSLMRSHCSALLLGLLCPSLCFLVSRLLSDCVQASAQG